MKYIHHFSFLGSCLSLNLGYSGCCDYSLTFICSDNGCYCDRLCHIHGDCCSDIASIGCHPVGITTESYTPITSLVTSTVTSTPTVTSTVANTPIPTITIGKFTTTSMLTTSLFTTLTTSTPIPTVTIGKFNIIFK